METNTETVCKEIRARRKYGRTACRVREWICEAPGATNSAVDAIDAFVAEMGFTGLGRMWAEISLDQARAILQQILQKDLAYQLPIMTEKDALGLADRFLAFFDEGIRCFTNGNAVLPSADPEAPPGACSPITTATFDSGIVCFDTKRIGILWVEDED